MLLEALMKIVHTLIWQNKKYNHIFYFTEKLKNRLFDLSIKLDEKVHS